LSPQSGTAQQASRQKWIGRAPAAKEIEDRIRQQNDGSDDRERELKSGGEKFVCVPAEKKERRCGQTVEQKNFRSKNTPPNMTALIVAARTLETCSPVTAA
jgi:hypothetical protein